jgi:hypothetical protein
MTRPAPNLDQIGEAAKGLLRMCKARAIKTVWVDAGVIHIQRFQDHERSRISLASAQKMIQEFEASGSAFELRAKNISMIRPRKRA